MQIVPATVGAASRRWDDHHLRLGSAAGLVGGAGGAGFTGPVSGTASRFLSTWRRHADQLAADCEEQADGLRTVIGEFLASDQAAFEDVVALGGFLEEVR